MGINVDILLIQCCSGKMFTYGVGANVDGVKFDGYAGRYGGLAGSRNAGHDD